MEGKKFLNTKNIVIVLISCLLIGASAIGIAIFLNDRGQAEAFEKQEQNLPVTGSDEKYNSQTEENIVEKIDSIIPNEDEENSAVIIDAETSSEEAIRGATNSTAEPIVEGVEETILERERKLYEDLQLSWTTIDIPAITTNMEIYKPELQIEKTAIEVVKNEDGTTIEVESKNKPRVRAGDIIIFRIEVSNVGNYKATNVVVTDSLDVIFAGEEVKAGKPLATIWTLDYGKKAILKVGYVVTEEDVNATEIVNDVEIEKDIYNVATATDGRTTVEDNDDMPVNPDVELEINKIWKDENNQDGIRTENITVELLANETPTGITATITGNGENWTYTFKKLPKYDENKELIIYTALENDVESYETSYEISDAKVYIYNTHIPETIEKTTVTKVWEDENNQDGKRPNSIEIQLYKTLEGETEAISMGNKYKVTLTAGEDEKWDTKELTYTWENLPKYENGKKITYTVKEITSITDYTTSYSEDTFTITNTHKPELTEITGKKTWDDANNQDGIRPNEIKINLFAGLKNIESKIITKKDNWTWKFENLPVYKEGNKIYYTISEDTVKNYTTKIDGYDITNTHKPEKVNVVGSKTWDDEEDENGKRPESIIVNLLKNGKEYRKQTVTKSGNWSYSFTDLDKYEDGEEIDYTIQEEPIAEYTPTYSDKITNTQTGDIVINIKNTYKQEITGTITTLEVTEQPLDVVFVLDISSSMLKIDSGNTKTRAELMVEATNNAIKKLMSRNSNNKVSIVLFNTNVKTLIPLDHYSTTGDYIEYSTETNDANNVGAMIKFVGGYTAEVATSYCPTGTDDNEILGSCGAAKAGTYTQGGLKKATEILLGSLSKTGRKPVMILLTDGNPTHYDEGTTYNSWQTKQPGGDSAYAPDKYGRERYITAEYYVFTMKTMQNAQQSLAAQYGSCDIYTVGINMEGSMAQVLLNPTTENINILSDEENVVVSKEVHNSTDRGDEHLKYSVKIDGNWYSGATYYKKQAAKLYTLLTSGNTAITSNYIKTAYTQSTAKDISSNFNEIVNTIIKTETTTITAENYGKDRKIELSGFNETNNSQFSLKVAKVGETTLLIDTTTISEAMEKGFITKNTETGKYYLDLSKTIGEIGVTLKYHK